MQDKLLLLMFNKGPPPPTKQETREKGRALFNTNFLSDHLKVVQPKLLRICKATFHPTQLHRLMEEIDYTSNIHVLLIEKTSCCIDRYTYLQNDDTDRRQEGIVQTPVLSPKHMSYFFFDGTACFNIYVYLATLPIS